MKDHVFTYWEGKPYAFTQLCIDSIRQVFGARHVHLTPKSLGSWIDADNLRTTERHISFRSDLIRTMLLCEHGGWWFDSDILLFRDPSDLVQPVSPMIWNLMYKVDGRWVPLINNGILYTPAHSPWIRAIRADFQQVDRGPLSELTWNNEDIGQNIYERHSVGTGLATIGHEHDFNSTYNVDADFSPFWDGRIMLDSATYGIHIGASLSRWAARSGNDLARQTIEIPSLEQLVGRFPKSVVAQYVERFGHAL